MTEARGSNCISCHRHKLEYSWEYQQFEGEILVPSEFLLVIRFSPVSMLVLFTGLFSLASNMFCGVSIFGHVKCTWCEISFFLVEFWWNLWMCCNDTFEITHGVKFLLCVLGLLTSVQTGHDRISLFWIQRKKRFSQMKNGWLSFRYFVSYWNSSQKPVMWKPF